MKDCSPLKKKVMLKKLAMMKKEMDMKDMGLGDEDEEKEELAEEEGGSEGESEESIALADDAPSSESDILDEDDDMDRESLRAFMKGSKPEKKKGVVTVMVAAKAPKGSPFKSKSKRA